MVYRIEVRGNDWTVFSDTNREVFSAPTLKEVELWLDLHVGNSAGEVAEHDLVSCLAAS